MKLSIIPSPEYPRHELEIPSWYAEKFNITLTKSEISIVSQSNDSFVIKLKKSNQEKKVSKYYCQIIERKEVSLGNWGF